MCTSNLLSVLKEELTIYVQNGTFLLCTYMDGFGKSGPIYGIFACMQI